MNLSFIRPAQASGRRRTSIRAKLVALVAASVGVAALLGTGVSVYRESHRDAALQSERLSAAAAVLASNAARSTAAGDASGAFEAIRAITLMPDVSYARVERAKGGLLAETGSGARLVSDTQVGGAGQGGGLLGLLSSHTIEVSAPVTDGGRRIGTVVILGKAKGATDRLLASLLTSLLAGLAAGAIGLMVAWRLQRRITGPLVSLTRSMVEVEHSHDYSRVVETASDDEVGDLVRGFNRMMTEIRTRDAEIAGHVEGLEATVAERTADLSVAKDAAEQANSAKSDFLATMSHEIRTPMNGIMVMAEMLAAGDMPPRLRRFAEVIAKSGSSLLAIINDILDFSKIEAGKLELDPQPIDPADVVDDVLSLFWERARSKGLDLAAFVHPAVPALISADEVRLRQVVGNLINNAIKFTERGGVFVKVAPAADGRLTFAVEDTGIGIAQDKIADLFGAFTQADQSTTRKFGGTGLGLAISKRLVESMDGAFEVTSRLGKGSVFAFTIPADVLEEAAPWPRVEGERGGLLAVSGLSTRRALGGYLMGAGLKVGRDQGETAPAVMVAETSVIGDLPQGGPPTICVADYADTLAEPGRAPLKADAVLVQPFRRRDLRALLTQLAAGEPLKSVEHQAARGAEMASFSGYRLLVADDSAVNREVAVEALARLGVAASTVCDGREAVDAALGEGFDLILMDGSMPEMDGYEATVEIRRREAEVGRAPTPIVALTAHVVGRAADSWREAGMDAVLHKPFTLAALARCLGQFLEPRPDEARPAAEGDAEAPPATFVANDPELIDPQVAADMAAMAASGRSDFVERVLTLYRDNAPTSVARLREAFDAADVTAVARAAHALKSMSLNIGARKVSELCARIETEAREQALIDRSLLVDLEEALPATLRAIGGGYGTAAQQAAAAPAFNAADAAERELLARLERALVNDELTLVYQPQTDRDGETVVGVECLIRWPGAPKGVGPDTFIPLAERSGLIGRITPWVIDRALRETADLAPLNLAFNASALDVCNAGFAEMLGELIARHHYDPRRVEVEITETAVLHSGDQVRATVAALHDMGIKVALDDFGAGYSSLSHLRLVPFDKLKIDKGFVAACTQDVKSAAVIHAMVSMGRALGMKVVAEGVETELQHRFLKVTGVHSMQGYLFGKPGPLCDLRLEQPEPMARTG
jgi:two-component system, NarL family, sensor histidine kinase BarA